ncbi:hypothetical protein F66182_3543 [Fusarium sp. NRRL 66182]|nr:hypothetical protein F66182_3543 [Fusarium sp. NRRL 66182]
MRVTGESWQVQPMNHPKSVKWHIRVPGPDMVNLINGFAPQQMEDKRMSRTDGPDKQGNVVVHMYRSWTGHEFIALKGRVSISGDHNDLGDVEKNGGEIFEIVWEHRVTDESEPMTEEEAKDLAIGLSRGLMNCNLDQE